METNGFSRRAVAGSTTLHGNLLDPKSWRNPRRDLDDARPPFHPPPFAGCFVERLSITRGKERGGIRAREYFIYHRNCFFSLFGRDDDICQRGLFPSGNLLQRGYEVGKERELNWIGRFTTDESTNKIHFVLLTFSNRVRASSIILR